MIAWHFTKSMHLAYRDGREIAQGEWLTAPPGHLVLCGHGMHASVRLIDALGYAPGSLLHRVELDGEIIRGDDKVVARRRRVLWTLDAEAVLHEFACRCAEDVLHLVPASDVGSHAIATKRRWLRGEATDAELAAASDAAWDAARDAASNAAWAAAWAAAWDASRAVAWAASRDAARAVAWAASRDAAWDAARDAARAVAWAASSNAASAAASAAARTRQNRRLTSMVTAARRKS